MYRCTYFAFAMLIGLQAASAQTTAGAAAAADSPPQAPADQVLITMPAQAKEMAEAQQDYARSLELQAKSLKFFLKPKTVKAAYLGVGVTSADPTLRAQLKLEPGLGLAVVSVDDNGPAKSVVQEHDVLYKFGDQLLVNPEQFIVLVRMHKAGDSVELTIIREAQPIKVTATLIEKEVPESVDAARSSGFTGGFWPPQPGTIQIENGGNGENP
jgi:S1-C subfamily serine protease